MMADHRMTTTQIWNRPIDRAIRLRLCINGDKNFEGKDVRLNKKRQRTFDSWLRDLSRTMNLRCGAVYRLFTPNHGHRVNDFDCLQDGNTIVVAGKERFDKAISYMDISAARKQSPQRQVDTNRSFRLYQQVSAKFSKQQTQGTMINVWANGDFTNKPSCFCLPHKQMTDLDSILEEVSRKMCLKCGGPVDSLCFPNGKKVRSPDDIVPNGKYVAVARNQTYKFGEYTDCTRPTLMTSSRLKLPPISYSNKTSSQSSPEHSTSSNNGYRRERARRGESEGFHVHPVKHKRSSEKARQADYDQDNGGVFKAKSQNQATRGAKQVQDSRQTKTELPIDQRPAEEVKEEVKGKDKKGKKQQQKQQQQQEQQYGRRQRDDEWNSRNPNQTKQKTYRANAKRQDTRDRSPPPPERYEDGYHDHDDGHESPYRSGTDLVREDQQKPNRQNSWDDPKDHDRRQQDVGEDCWGYEDLERMEREKQAAIKIQAGCRGMMARRKVKAMRRSYY